MRAATFAALVIPCAGALAACGSTSTDGPPEIEPGAELLGGETTVFDETQSAYSLPARNLDRDGRDVFSLGDHFFNRNWVSAPASTSANDGLGPLFNAVSCSACHLRDGRSAPPQRASDGTAGLLFRLSVSGADEHGGPLADPSYGGQLQPLAIVGVPREGAYSITYEERPGAFADGEPYALRVPGYSFGELGYGPLAPDVMFSPRTAPSMIGLGLLESVPEEAIRALADPDDRDHDGISGRVNDVWDAAGARMAVGRFGWKANVPTIVQQVAGAFLGDLGITTSLFPTEGCTSAEGACLAAPNGGTPELADDTLNEVVHYSRCLGVPARRRVADPLVRAGERLFAEARCTSCHTPKLVTDTSSPIAALHAQTIRPYTDLLVHDMGPELADGRPDFAASGAEWRTAPLWGLGLLATVSRHTMLLHDGRARDATEAILWHGGEATASRDAFRAMPRSDRLALLAFLGSL
jgi:CxxC motif-containing protein (DUF1111 family)